MLDGAGEPVPDGLLEAWGDGQFARCRTDAQGAFHFTVRRPRSWQDRDGHVHAPYLDVAVFARGLLRQLMTRVYFPDEEDANGADPVLRAVDPDLRRTLIARVEGKVLRFDIRLQGDDETVFFAP